MGQSTEIGTTTLERLFEAQLQYQIDADPVISHENRDGVHVGSGDGTVAGDRINGDIRWSLYSGNCAYVYVRAGTEPPPDQHLCTVHPGGVIITDDGAEIWFDASGYGLRGYDPAQPQLWRLTMSVQFTTTDKRYTWLNATLGVLVSRFDEQRGRAQWVIFAPK